MKLLLLCQQSGYAAASRIPGFDIFTERPQTLTWANSQTDARVIELLRTEYTAQLKDILSRSSVNMNDETSTLECRLITFTILHRIKKCSQLIPLELLSNISFLIESIENEEYLPGIAQNIVSFKSIAESFDWLNGLGINYSELSDKNYLLSLLALDQELKTKPDMFSKPKIQTILEGILQDYLPDTLHEIPRAIQKLKIHNHQYSQHLKNAFIPKLFKFICTSPMQNIDELIRLGEIITIHVIDFNKDILTFLRKLKEKFTSNLDTFDLNTIFIIIDIYHHVEYKSNKLLFDSTEKVLILNKILSTVPMSAVHIDKLFKLQIGFFKHIPDGSFDALNNYLFEHSDTLKALSKSLQMPSWPDILSALEARTSGKELLEKNTVTFMHDSRCRAIIKAAAKLQSSDKMPKKYDATSYSTATLCAAYSHKMGLREPDNESLMEISLLAYVIYALNSGNPELLDYAFRYFLEMCNQRAWFKKYGMFESNGATSANIASRLIIADDFARVLNFYSDTDLTTYNRKTMLPKILNATGIYEITKELTGSFDPRDLQERICSSATNEASSFSSNPNDLYEIIAKHYNHTTAALLPSVFEFFCQADDHKARSFILPFNVLVRTFPVSIYSQSVHAFTQRVKYLTQRAELLTIDELFTVLNIIEYNEIRSGSICISKKPRQKLFERMLQLLTASDFISSPSIIDEALRFKWTIFNIIDRKEFSPLDDLFRKECDAKALRHHQDKCSEKLEDVLVKSLLEKLNTLYSLHVRTNRVCPETGREIDIAYTNGKLKIALHIDGKPYHYYPGRDLENSKTIARDEALKNAGWKNYCFKLVSELSPIDGRPLPFSKEKTNIFASTAKAIIEDCTTHSLQGTLTPMFERIRAISSIERPIDVSSLQSNHSLRLTI